MNGLSVGALAKMTSLAQPKPSCDLVRSAASFKTWPSLEIASMLIPAAVVPTFTEAQTRLVVERTSGSVVDEAAIPLGPSLLNQRGESADEVDAHLGGDFVQRAGDRQIPSAEWQAATPAIGLTAMRRLTIGMP